MDSFNTRLEQRLDELDRSFSWLAGKVGVHRGTVARWARGEMAVAEPHRKAVAGELKLGVGVLFDKDGNVKPAQVATH